MLTRRGFLGYLGAISTATFVHRVYVFAPPGGWHTDQDPIALRQTIYQINQLVFDYVVPVPDLEVYRPVGNVLGQPFNTAYDAYPSYQVLHSEPCIREEKIIPGPDRCSKDFPASGKDRYLSNSIAQAASILRENQRRTRRLVRQVSLSQLSSYDSDENYLYGYGRT
jgi:hypothetical protein